MKKSTNLLEYSAKGTLTTFDDDIIHTEIVGKKDTKIDEIKLEEFLEDIKTFANSTVGREVEFKFSFKVMD